jgi:transcriptional regulator with XRE-family HTH domain
MPMKKLIVYDITKTLCDNKNITIAKLERDLNFSEGSISKWKITTPSANKILAVAEYFNVSVDYMVGRISIQQTANDILNDENIIAIQVAREHMTNEDKDKMMKLLKLTFQNSF